jgi:hypothetical protein
MLHSHLLLSPPGVHSQRCFTHQNLVTFLSDLRLQSKENLSLYTSWRRLGALEVKFLLILDLGVTWGKWSASLPGRALPQGKGPPPPPRYPTHRSCVWPTACLDVQAWRKIVSLYRESSPGRPTRCQIQQWLGYPCSHSTRITHHNCLDTLQCDRA